MTNSFLKTLVPGQTMATPQSSDLVKDRIAKSRVENIMLLLDLHIAYKNYTSNPDTLFTSQPSRGYPDEDKLPRNLQVLHDVFAAHAQGFPNNEFFPANDDSQTLNLVDPGDDLNGIILREKLANERSAAANLAISPKIQNYVTGLTSLTLDPTTSKGIARKPIVGLPTSQSMNQATKTYSLAVSNISFYEGSFTIPSYYDSIRKWFKRDQSRNFKDLPMCSALPDLTDTDETEISNLSTNAFNEAEGRGAYQKIIKVTVKAQAAATKVSVSDLPEGAPAPHGSGAPDWVVNYVKKFGIIGNDASKAQKGTTATYIVSAFNTDDPDVALDSAWQKLTAAFGSTIIDLNVEANQDEFKFSTENPEVYYAFVKYVGVSYMPANLEISHTGGKPVDPATLTPSYPVNSKSGEPLKDSTIKFALKNVSNPDYVASIKKYIEAFSKIYSGIRVSEIQAIICQETKGVPGLISEKGAVGLMQVLPSTAAKDLGMTDSAEMTGNTDSQIKYGVKYYAMRLRQFNGNRLLAIGSYNSGPYPQYAGKYVYEQGLIPGCKETINYVKQVPWWEQRIQQL